MGTTRRVDAGVRFLIPRLDEPFTDTAVTQETLAAIVASRAVPPRVGALAIAAAIESAPAGAEPGSPAEWAAARPSTAPFKNAVSCRTTAFRRPRHHIDPKNGRPFTTNAVSTSEASPS